MVTQLNEINVLKYPVPKPCESYRAYKNRVDLAIEMGFSLSDLVPDDWACYYFGTGAGYGDGIDPDDRIPPKN